MADLTDKLKRDYEREIWQCWNELAVLYEALARDRDLAERMSALVTSGSDSVGMRYQWPTRLLDEHAKEVRRITRANGAALLFVTSERHCLLSRVIDDDEPVWNDRIPYVPESELKPLLNWCAENRSSAGVDCQPVRVPFLSQYVPSPKLGIVWHSAQTEWLGVLCVTCWGDVAQSDADRWRRSVEAIKNSLSSFLTAWQFIGTIRASRHNIGNLQQHTETLFDLLRRNLSLLPEESRKEAAYLLPRAARGLPWIRAMLYPTSRRPVAMRLEKLTEELRKRAESETDCCDITCTPTPNQGYAVYMDPAECSQVIENVCRNIRIHAWAEKSPSTREIAPDKRKVRISVEPAESWAIISIVDNGVGFETGASETRRNKRDGLRSSSLKVEKAGGYMSIDSTPATGTTVQIQLPLVRLRAAIKRE